VLAGGIWSACRVLHLRIGDTPGEVMTIHHGDCVEVMAAMPPDSIDAIVCDPPYGLEFMGKEWDRLRPDVGGRDDLRGSLKGERTSGGEFGERIGIRYGTPNKNARCRKCYKLKHDHPKSKCNCASPDWDERKSEYGYAMQWWHQEWATAALRVAKPGAYLLAFGGTRTVHRMTVALEDAGWIIRDMLVWAYASGFPKSKALLKPAWEPIVMARKPGPLRDLDIDGCRIPAPDADLDAVQRQTDPSMFQHNGGNVQPMYSPSGRWPANVVLTDEVLDEYSRFFLVPKASRSDREPVMPGMLEERNPFERGGPSANFERMGSLSGPRRNVHPTVKPIELMRHLVRLVTPIGGTCLDPFGGSGTTALACEAEGRDWVLIEREAEYVRIAEARLAGWQRGLGLDVA
jgi:DNA modification methylase